MIGLFLGIMAFALVTAALFLALKSGKDSKHAENEEAINRAVLEAALYRDRLDHDPYYAERLRERFTRKLLPDLPPGISKPERQRTDKKTGRGK